jgi:hypothetical protein
MKTQMLQHFYLPEATGSMTGGFSYLKKYLLKRIDFENADFEGLNSNKPTAQTTLNGDIIAEEKYFLLGFVNGADLLIEEELWFIILNSKQLNLLTDCLKEKAFP